MDYFKQRRAYRNLKMYEANVSNGQNNLYRELLDYANDEGKLDVLFPMKNSALLSLTGLSEAGIKKARNELTQAGLIEYVRGRKNSFAPKYRIIKLYKDTVRATKSQKSSSDGTDKVAQMVPQTVAQKVAHKELTNTDSNSTSKKKPSRSKKTERYLPTDPPYKIAVHLYERIKEHQPDLKKPKLQNWANDIRLAHEQDKRDYQKLDKLVDWSQSNAFWQGNILSADKLRKKYDTLTGQANAEFKQKKAHQKETLPGWASEASKKPEPKNLTAEQQAKLAEQLAELKKTEKVES